MKKVLVIVPTRNRNHKTKEFAEEVGIMNLPNI